MFEIAKDQCQELKTNIEIMDLYKIWKAGRQENAPYSTLIIDLLVFQDPTWETKFVRIWKFVDRILRQVRELQLITKADY